MHLAWTFWSVLERVVFHRYCAVGRERVLCRGAGLVDLHSSGLLLPWGHDRKEKEYFEFPDLMTPSKYEFK